MKPATTVTKVCRIIDELATRQGLGVSDLSRRTALLPSDVHRILKALRMNGYVGQDTETKKYQLGVQLLRLGLEACQRNELYERAHPIVVELSHQLGTATHLAAFDRRELDVFLIANVNGPAGFWSRARFGPGEGDHIGLGMARGGSRAREKRYASKYQPHDYEPGCA
jgi:DNA-binding IclR family transcriptional regulator